MVGRYWEEIGVDAERFVKVLAAKKRPHVSLIKRLDPQSLGYVKTRFGLATASDKDAIKRLLEANPRAATDIYVLCRALQSFSQSKIAKYYEDEIEKGRGETDLYRLLRLYFEKPAVLKKVFFSKLLSSKEYTMNSYPLRDAQNFPSVDFAGLDERTSERLARRAVRGAPQKREINVWFILQEDGATAIFIFKKTKNRRRFVVPTRRRYRFLSDAKLTILQFSEQGKKVGIVSKEKKRARSLAASILAGSLGPQAAAPVYEAQERPQPNSAIDSFITQMKNGANPDFSLEQIRFGIEHGSDLVVLKRGDPLGVLLDSLSHGYNHGKLNAENVGELRVTFRGKSFAIRIEPGGEGSSEIRYSTRAGAAYRKDFEKEMRENYSLEISKRG